MGGGGEGSTRERAVERPVSSGDDVADLVCCWPHAGWVEGDTVPTPAYLATMFFPPSLSLSVCLARHALRRSQRIDLSYIIHGGDV